MRQAKQVCKDMMVGLFIWMIPVMVILTVVATHRFAVCAGVLIGTATAALLIWHMYRHLDIALDMDAKHAQSHTQFAALQRMFIMGVVLAVSMIFSQYVHPIGVVFGIFGMKISAFLYPKIHPYLVKRRRQKKMLKAQ